jgi:monovalent cation:H+ antiporter-2, CPA2 family
VQKSVAPIAMHDISLITTIAFGFTAALFFGLIAKRLGLSPIVGYILAGVVAGPNTPGFVGDVALASQLAEIGVIMLMFGVGLHFHLQDLLKVRAVAIPGALVQSAFATLACTYMAHELGWSWSQGVVLGIATSVASTVVLLRVLIDNGVLETSSGHAVVGWLIVEDLITVLVLVVLPALGTTGSEGESSVLATAGIALIKLVVLGLVVAVVGTRVVPWLLLRVARLRSPELFTLTVLVMSIAVATAAYAAFGVSMALGAFLAGMLVGQSKFSHQAGADMLPLRDAFAVLFFVSIGMLFDSNVLINSPALVVGVAVVILVVKPIVAFAIVVARRYTLKTALMAAGALAQIGEFSFIVADVAFAHQLLPKEAHAVLVAGAIVSISVNPFFFKWMLALEPVISQNKLWLRWFAHLANTRGAAANADFDAPSGTDRFAVVIGYGPVGSTVTDSLVQAGIEPVVVDMNVDTVAELQLSGRRALYGDATRREILEQAGVEKASHVIITPPDPATRLAIIASARDLNPGVIILTRARFLAEHESLRAAGASVVCCDEAGAATALVETLLDQVGGENIDVSRELRRIRDGWSTQKFVDGKSSL